MIQEPFESLSSIFLLKYWAVMEVCDQIGNYINVLKKSFESNVLCVVLTQKKAKSTYFIHFQFTSKIILPVSTPFSINQLQIFCSLSYIFFWKSVYLKAISLEVLSLYFLFANFCPEIASQLNISYSDDVKLNQCNFARKSASIPECDATSRRPCRSLTA